ncbi:MAG: polynucleotide adenylyltransferase [Bacilli bacterium]
MEEIVKVIFRYLRKNIDEKYQLYLVGGSSRDYLLGKKFTDFDFATNAPFEYLIEVFPKCKNFYRKYGIVNLKYGDFDITLACLRKEKLYLDNRHPSVIKFIDDPVEDAKRRDFTINAIYIDSKGKVIDPFGGKTDLKGKIIRMIGDIPSRINEDPVRILRAFRFEDTLGFRIEDKLKKYCEDNIWRIEEINSHKLKIELEKCSNKAYLKIQSLLSAS